MRIGHIVVDDFGETGQVRIFLVEHLKDFLGVDVVLCKDDRFAQLTAVVDGQALGHQRMQHLTDGILVENPLVQSRGRNTLRKLTVFICEGILVCLSVRVGKLVVDDALLNEFQLRLHGNEVHQIAILDRLRQIVAVGRHTVLQLKNLVGVLVDLVLGSGGQAHQRCVKIIEDIPILVVD